MGAAVAASMDRFLFYGRARPAAREEKTMKFNYMTIFVRDLERSCAFYEQLAQLRVLRRITPPGGQIAFLGNAPGETMLELVAFPQGEKVEAKGLTISFQTGENLETCAVGRRSWAMRPRRSFPIRPSPTISLWPILTAWRWNSPAEGAPKGTKAGCAGGGAVVQWAAG